MAGTAECIVKSGQYWSALVSSGQHWLVLVSTGQYWSALVSAGKHWSAQVTCLNEFTAKDAMVVLLGTDAQFTLIATHIFCALRLGLLLMN